MLVFVDFAIVSCTRRLQLLLQRDGVGVRVLNVTHLSTAIPLRYVLYLEAVQLLLHKKRLNQHQLATIG